MFGKSQRALQAAVHSALAGHPVASDAPVAVSVRNGYVRLSGTVRTFGEKWAVEDALDRVKGIRAVYNEVLVELHRASPELPYGIAPLHGLGLLYNDRTLRG